MKETEKRNNTIKVIATINMYIGPECNLFCLGAIKFRARIYFVSFLFLFLFFFCFLTVNKRRIKGGYKIVGGRESKEKIYSEVIMTITFKFMNIILSRSIIHYSSSVIVSSVFSMIVKINTISSP